MEEATAAKEYWSSTDFQKKEYDQFPPFYIAAICRIVRFLKISSVFEFGCNAGRNLSYLRGAIGSHLCLKGIDINEKSIAFGQETWNLDISVGDEQFLQTLEADSFDFIFTISVLDHIPAIEECLAALHRVSARYFLALEPLPESELSYLTPFQEEGLIAPTVATATPFSYTHSLRERIPRAGFVERLRLPCPTYRKNFGPLYQILLYEKESVSKSSDIDFSQLLDVLIFECALQTISAGEQLRSLETQRQKFSKMAYDLKKQLEVEGR
ncbi:MAG: methyltransferase domain-containing protein [Bdellovibrionales bacterium]|nr:methyltransferase domain-containing protein [Bdellovibrionales bacterium]